MLSAVAPATADEAGWKKLAEIRESYAALNHYQDDTRRLFSSGTKNKILAENEARFVMASGSGDYFSLSNFLGVNFYGAEGARTAYQYQVKRYRTIAAEEAWRSVHPVVSFSDVAYPVLGQLLDASWEIAAAYRVIGTPAIAVIGKDGVVREIRAGQWPSMAEDVIARIRAAAAE